MGILSRFKDIISANINALLDKAEDPAKMVDQYLVQAMDDLAEVKKETAAVMAEESRCKRILDEANADVQKYTELAKRALAAGNEGDARVFIEKKQSIEGNIEAAQKAYDAARANADKMRQMHDKLAADIEALRTRKEQVKATVAVAKTQEKVNKAGAAFAKAGGARDKFERMEEKAQNMLDKASAMAELNSPAQDSAEELEKKYSKGGSASVEDELARLKAEMGV